MTSQHGPAHAPAGDPYPPLELSPILEATLTEITEHGYDGTSVRRIAARLGVTVPALYYHFANKQAMLVALVEEAMGRLVGRVREVHDAAGDDPVERLRALVEAVALHATHYQRLAVLQSELRSLEPDHRARYIASRDEVEDLVRRAVEDGLVSGVFTTPHPAEATRGLLQMVQGIATWYRPDGSSAPTDIARRHVDLALSLVGHRPAGA